MFVVVVVVVACNVDVIVTGDRSRETKGHGDVLVVHQMICEGLLVQVFVILTVSSRRQP
jgi:hypothetical protein